MNWCVLNETTRPLPQPVFLQSCNRRPVNKDFDSELMPERLFKLYVSVFSVVKQFLKTRGHFAPGFEALRLCEIRSCKTAVMITLNTLRCVCQELQDNIEHPAR